MQDRGAADETAIFDVIVVGGGGSGLTAAAVAAAAGATTLLLEKYDSLGGTTALSVGSFTAACTRQQLGAGVSDSSEAFCQDMVAFAPHLADRDQKELRHLLAEEASTTLEWLENIGVTFAGPFPEPPNRVPRMYNAIPSARQYLTKLIAECRRVGVEMRLNSEVVDLVFSPQGRVIGVEISGGNIGTKILARKAVVLASGDFSGDRERLQRYTSPSVVAALPIRPKSTGDLFAVAERHSIPLRGMDIVFGPQLRFPRAPTTPWTTLLPDWSVIAQIGALFIRYAPRSLLKLALRSLLLANMSPVVTLFEKGAVLIDLDGRTLESQNPADALAGARDATGYILLDRQLSETFSSYPHFVSTAPGIAYAYFSDYRRARPDIVHEGATYEELASKVGLRASDLRTAGKKLGVGPYFALGPVQAMLVVTEGGVAVDTTLRVLSEQGAPIPGLYAAGAAGQGGLWLKGHGLHLAWAFTSGRIAGGNAASEVPF